MIPSTTIIPIPDNTKDPLISLINVLRTQVIKALQGKLLYPSLCDNEYFGYGEGFKNDSEGYKLKVSPSLMPEFWALCSNVKKQLGFNEPLDIYIENDSEINAFATASPDKETPHIITINSGLFNIMSNEEMRFVIGHEIGHLICEDSKINCLYNFVKGDNEEKMPSALVNKMRLLGQLAELLADRHGYHACGDIDTCVRAMYKLASGLNLEKAGVNLKNLIADNSERLRHFMSAEEKVNNVHPVNPIRIEALRNLAASRNDEVIDIMDILAVLIEIDDSEEERCIAAFIASAGLKVAQMLDGMTVQLLDEILRYLFEFSLFAYEYLQQMAELDFDQIYDESIQRLLSLNCSLQRKGGMLTYMIDLALANDEMTQECLEMIYDLCHRLSIDESEVGDQIACFVRDRYLIRAR